MRNAYLVCYDIASPKRWRKVHSIMLGHGDPVQLSVFLCSLSPSERQVLLARLHEVIHHGGDALALIDMGPAESGRARMTTFGTVRWEAGKRVIVI